MNPQQVIESYIDDVALLLPRRLRNDIGLELRTLLNDELQAAAKSAGRAPDGEMAIALVRDFGQPAEVAARYRPRGFTIIEPEHGPLFVKLAAIGLVLQWSVALPLVFTGQVSSAAWWLIWWGALWWPGALVVWFGAAGWVRRRWPVDPETLVRPAIHWLFWLPDIEEDWRPPDSRMAAGNTEPGIGPAVLGALVSIFFVSPVWFLGLLTPDTVDVSWARYAVEFRQWLLVPLLAVIAARLVLHTLALLSEHWRARTEWMRIGLWIVFVGLLAWSMVAWDIFASDLIDAFFKVWLSIFLLVNFVLIGVWIRRVLARVRLPKEYSR